LTPGKVTPLKLPEGSAPQSAALEEVPKHRLRILDKLGEGTFGLVSKFFNYILREVLAVSFLLSIISPVM